MHLVSPVPSLPADILDAHALIETLRAQVSHLESLALLDPLTGIANRRAFDDRLASAFAHAQRTAAPLAVVVMDVDDFKVVNDTLGHAAGDSCLKALAAQLRAHTRRGDMVARIGGEEFALLMSNTSDEGAIEMCRRLVGLVRTCCTLFPLTLSIGIAQVDASMADGSTILDYADRAMYQAKQSGKDRIVFHQPKFRRSIFQWR